MSLAAGSRLGPYSISGLLGVGGMGEVYRARDAKLNRDVAIKILPASVAADPARLARFQREAQVLASLNHRHIAAIYGLEESDGATALVMELVEGPTLGERIADGPIPLDEALTLARQIGEALEAAHEKGIVHRDLKPANIKLAAGSEVKVLDFGLAKAYTPEVASGGDRTNSPTLTLEGTRAGTIMGTAAYMSPEQARGKPVDKRADIWAFGVVLMEMLTGKSMFDGETVSDILAAVLRADVDLRDLPATTPPRVRRLLQRCLERDPKRRLRDIGDAWIEIDAPAETTFAPPAPLKGGNRWLPWFAAAVLGGAGIAWGLLHRPAVAAAVPVHWRLTETGLFVLPALSHDGSQMVLTEANGKALRLVGRRMDENELRPIRGGDGLVYAEFSPDGQWIAAYSGAATSDWTLNKLPLSGGSAIALAKPTTALGLTWGDDDSIVYAGSEGLTQIASSGGAGQILAAPDKSKGETQFYTPHFLPGSRTLMFTIVSASSSKAAILDLKTRRYHVVAENAKDARYVASGHLIFARGDALFAAPFDTGSLKVTGLETPVIQGLAFNGPSSMVAEYAVSDNGTLLYGEASIGTGRSTTLGWVDRKGQTQEASDRALWGTGRLSPDGRRVADEIYTDTVGDGLPGDIWILELERHIKTRLTFGGANSYPIWTPDGRRITYLCANADRHGICTVMADGSAKPQLLLATDTNAIPQSWSPDGQTLFYGVKHHAIWVLPVSGGTAGKPALLHDSPADEAEAEVSPDGHWLAYISSETGQNEAYLQPYPGPGGKERISTDGADSVRWAHDGHELFYISRLGQGTLTSLEIQTKPQLHFGQPVLLAKNVFGTTWDPAPDGKRLLVELVRTGNQGGSSLRGISDWFQELRRHK